METLHVVGQPGFPVILTSLFDDTVGAGLRPDGRPQADTNNDGIGSIPQAADWRGLFIDQYSNDRNVGIVLENENFTAAAPGPNGTPTSAQVLGDLAATPSSRAKIFDLASLSKVCLARMKTSTFTVSRGSREPKCGWMLTTPSMVRTSF